MKKTDLLNLAIRIIGIILFLYSINSIKELLFYFALPINSIAVDECVSFIGVLLFTIIIQWILAALLMFKSDSITNLLIKNRDDHTQEFSPPYTQKDMLRSALVIIGITVIVLHLPDFIINTVKYIRLVQANDPSKSFDLTNVETSALKIILAYAMIYFSSQISTYFYQTNKD
ncbi:hypothetical protein [Sphingobacterium paucimobilis]|uniref:Uncharacterized protein n=1 Tax=Sphingobacterium paucimobilis HER1398 TaxID=1346330 RepID=U2HQW8_9SPHI|nr:hypothetical protein [Sphingobacterium paucimobilis]ERJ57877.1 hypothetical protein M472_03765 [Sphingobacterium paucimobilis HER1398]ERJ60328.1 hypothetical protein M472_16335 [Sphingobacterium paucimobilis HER1398]